MTATAVCFSGTMVPGNSRSRVDTLARRSCGVSLPLFYFHIIAETTFLDDEGTTFQHDQDALAHARQLAAELVKGGAARGVIVVESEADGGMFEVPLRAWHN
jgi:hypothetical protein